MIIRLPIKIALYVGFGRVICVLGRQARFSSKLSTIFDRGSSTPIDIFSSFSAEFAKIDETIERVESVPCNVEYKIPVKEYADLKEDVIEPSYRREEILKNAPRKDSISFILPKVVD